MSIATRSTIAKSGSDGFIIVAVLWILAALATLVSVYAIYVTNSAIAVTASGDAVIADPLVTAGVELAAYQLLGQKNETRQAAGKFTARVGSAQLAVVFQTEAARIDLNLASKELLTGLLLGFGAPPLEAGGYADRIVAWRTPAAGQAAGQNIDTDPESAFYRSAGLSYIPRHGPFAHVEELWLVHGIPPALIERMLPFVTVYSGRGQVDVIDAAPQVIAALPGMKPETVQAIVAARDAGALDRASLPGFLASAGEGAGASAPQAGKTFRVGVRVAFDNGRRSAAETVISLADDGPVPYRVLFWRNAFDGTTDQPLDFGRR
jgi:general secretion pathway protein K